MKRPDVGFLGSFGRFFFSPTDPTVLGFMRIMCGLVLLYVHAVGYSFQLSTTVGNEGWYDRQVANQFRRESSVLYPPLGWKEVHGLILVDDFIHRRKVQIDFLRSLSDDPSVRSRQLRLLDDMYNHANRSTYLQSEQIRAAAAIYEGLRAPYAILRLTKNQRDAVALALGMPNFKKEEVPIPIPYFVAEGSVEVRKKFWESVLDMEPLMPQEAEQADYLLNWFQNYPSQRRSAFVEYLSGNAKTLKAALPFNRTEREVILKYLETWGGDPRQADAMSTPSWSPFYHLSSWSAVVGFHAIGIVVIFLFTIGLFTRVTSVLTWIVSLSYIHRSNAIWMFGQDTMQTILVTYLMIAPSGAAMSIDAIRRRWRAAKAKLATPNKVIPWAEYALSAPPSSWLANMVMRMFQIHYCIIYMSGGLSKLKGTSWWNHQAAWMTMTNWEFGPIRYKAYEQIVMWMAEFRPILMTVMAVICIGTILLELSLPILVWTRLRPFIISCAMLFHTGISAMMGLTVFALFMFVLLLCYFPAALIRERLCWPQGSGTPLKLHFDSRNRRSLKRAAAIMAWDVSGQVTFIDRAGSGAAGGTASNVPAVDSIEDSKGSRSTDFGRVAMSELVVFRYLGPLRFIPGANYLFGIPA